MVTTLVSRYGELREFNDNASLEVAVRGLVAELCNEETARPDTEHSEVSVSHDSGWSVAATVKGTVVLRLATEPPRHLFALPPAELESLMLLVARGEIEPVRQLPWDRLPPATALPGDCYLFRSRQDMTDLHRAAAKGDCEWIRWEVKRGESLAAKDRSGATPLHWAALAGQAAASRLLIELGANLGDLDLNGVTPREYAEMSEEYLSEDEVHELLTLFEQ